MSEQAMLRAHRPDGGAGGPGAMCVECTPYFGTEAEEPVAWPCATYLAALLSSESTEPPTTTTSEDPPMHMHTSATVNDAASMNVYNAGAHNVHVQVVNDVWPSDLAATVKELVRHLGDPAQVVAELLDLGVLPVIEERGNNILYCNGQTYARGAVEAYERHAARAVAILTEARAHEAIQPTQPPVLRADVADALKTLEALDEFVHPAEYRKALAALAALPGLSEPVPDQNNERTD